MTAPATEGGGLRPIGLTFIGLPCLDREMARTTGLLSERLGSAVLCGAVAVNRLLRCLSLHPYLRVTAVMKARPDDARLRSLLAAEPEIVARIEPVAATPIVEILYPSPDDRLTRDLIFRHHPGPFSAEALLAAAGDTDHVHIAGISDREMPFTALAALVPALRARGTTVSIDMQGPIRQVGMDGRITPRDVTHKAEILGLMDYVKLDSKELCLLTGREDLRAGLAVLRDWARRPDPILVVTDDQRQGVWVYGDAGRWAFSAFSNTNSTGRSGRGDTTFGAFLLVTLLRRAAARDARLAAALAPVSVGGIPVGDCDLGRAARFASAVVSLKMEHPDYFNGSRAELETRLRQSHASCEQAAC